ncbi:MAG TPA: type VI secretion system tube protein TssD [Dinghuibacter sp.]|uniref:type VI secretion system tube protein TssD n=1 Tax=Dinghuibacter sp. TaxID=2024697 RepID=UPI002C57755B|nr:type VI secretion system tube protein TssD [Dinghuibacter sp.]HTJ10848.1 type VI secretion system tube protein TssD [Dinghuibacter sp.]
MSFAYNLHVDDKDFALLAFGYDLSQDALQDGKPASGVRGGRIRFLMEILDESFFSSWMFDWRSTKDGSITVNRIDQASKFKEIKFTKAYMMQTAESFGEGDAILMSPEAVGPIPHEIYQWTSRLQNRMDRSYVLFCEISAQTINVDGIAHDNKW